MKKKGMLLILCAVILFSVVSPSLSVFADEVSTPLDPPVEPDPFQEIAAINLDLEISDRGKSMSFCWVYVWDETMTVDLSMHLQRRTSSGNWETIKSWYTSGNEIVSLYKPWYVAAGYTYRLEVGVTVYDTEGWVTDTTGVYSLSVEY